MLQGLTPAERAQMAAAMGVSPQQLAQVKAHVYSSYRSTLLCCAAVQWLTSSYNSTTAICRSPLALSDVGL